MPAVGELVPCWALVLSLASEYGGVFENRINLHDNLFVREVAEITAIWDIEHFIVDHLPYFDSKRQGVVHAIILPYASFLRKGPILVVPSGSIFGFTVDRLPAG